MEDFSGVVFIQLNYGDVWREEVMTSIEYAAWVQAIGSILAIAGSVGVAIWQSNRQHADDLERQRLAQREVKVELAQTLSVISQNCSKAAEYVSDQLDDREKIHLIAHGKHFVDLTELNRLESAVAGVPLHSLPACLVSSTMALSATIRQYREKVEYIIQHHRTLNSDEFEMFLITIGEMRSSLLEIYADITQEVRKLEST